MNYELNKVELWLIVTALRFTAENGYTYEQERGGNLTEYERMKALIERLDPKPVRKSGWMNIYPGCQTVHETREDADKYANPSRIKCIEVYWEE